MDHLKNGTHNLLLSIAKYTQVTSLSGAFESIQKKKILKRKLFSCL